MCDGWVAKVAMTCCVLLSISGSVHHGDGSANGDGGRFEATHNLGRRYYETA